MPPGLGSVMPSHRVRQQHPELFTEANVLHAGQGDRGLSLADGGGLDIEGERGSCHIDAAATPPLSAETCAPARAGSPQITVLRCVLPPLDPPGCAGRRNCNVNLDDLDQDRPDLNCEPLQAPGTARNLQLDETGLVMMVVALFGSRLRSSGLVCGRGCGVRT
jgi:hypothetical protein